MIYSKDTVNIKKLIRINLNPRKTITRKLVQLSMKSSKKSLESRFKINRTMFMWLILASISNIRPETIFDLKIECESLLLYL